MVSEVFLLPQMIPKICFSFVLIFLELLRAFDGFNSFVIPDIPMRKMHTPWTSDMKCVSECVCVGGGGSGV